MPDRGKVLEVSCHRNLEACFRDSIAATGIATGRDGPLFRSLIRAGSSTAGTWSGNALVKCTGDVPELQEFRPMSAITRVGRRASLRTWKFRRPRSKWSSMWPITRTQRRHKPCERRAERVSLDGFERIGT